MNTYSYPNQQSGSDGKKSVCNAGNLGLSPGSRRFPGEGNVYPLQYSCLENLHSQRSLAGYSPWGHKELDMAEMTKHNMQNLFDLNLSDPVH